MLEIDEFFEGYAKAFSERRPAEITRFYAFPVVFYLINGSSQQMSQADFDENSQQLIAMYQELGMQSATFKIVSVVKMNPAISLVEVEWMVVNQRGEPSIGFSARYIVGVQSGELKILGVVMNDENAAIAEYSKANL
jgi:hypothetical protein